MPHTACATTATATTLSPCIAPAGNTAYPPVGQAQPQQDEHQRPKAA
jgi:hypothetical protein